MSGRRRKHAHAEHHVDERWLVSYADMITVLMALFIVLYAMSTVDSHKFDQLKNSLATGFGVTKTAKIDQSDAIVPKQYVKKSGAGFSNSTIAVMQVAKEITDELKAAGVAGKATVKAGSNTVTISLVGSSTYFDGNSDRLRPEAKRVLRVLDGSLKKHAGTVTVEGHADPRGSAGTFGNDWALGAARSLSVLLWLVDHGAVAAKDITSISHGSTDASDSASPAAIEHNRRVDIVLHTVQIGSVHGADTAGSGAKEQASASKESASKESAAKSSGSTEEASAEHH